MDPIPFDLLNEKQKSLVALMKEFCEREVDRKALNELADKPIPPDAKREQLETRIPWDLISKAQDIGLRQLCVPKEYGGGGLGFAPGDWVTLAALAEATGYYGGQAGRIFTIPWKHTRSLSTAPKAVQEEFFPAFMKNRKTMVAASITEPDHGSDLLIPYDVPGYSGKVIATQDGDYWVVNGEKMWCTAGGVSDYIILSVRTDKEGPISKSMSSFLLPTKTKGWSIARVNDFMGNEMTANVQMHFDNCRIHKRLMISKPNEAWLGTRSSLAGKSIHTTARLGETIWIWEQLKDYSRNRIQGGKPIIQHPNVGMVIAEAELLIQTARLLVYKFMWESDQSHLGHMVNPKGYWYINYWVKTIMQRIAAIGLDVYGGMGPHKDLPFERWVRFNFSLIHGGSSGTLSLIKASHTMW